MNKPAHLILHCFHAAKCGHRHIITRTVNNDVVVLAMSFFDRMPLTEPSVHFGVRRNTRVTAVHDVVPVIGNQRCSLSSSSSSTNFIARQVLNKT